MKITIKKVAGNAYSLNKKSGVYDVISRKRALKLTGIDTPNYLNLNEAVIDVKEVARKGVSLMNYNEKLASEMSKSFHFIDGYKTFNEVLSIYEPLKKVIEVQAYKHTSKGFIEKENPSIEYLVVIKFNSKEYKLIVPKIIFENQKGIIHVEKVR